MSEQKPAEKTTREKIQDLRDEARKTYASHGKWILGAGAIGAGIALVGMTGGFAAIGISAGAAWAGFGVAFVGTSAVIYRKEQKARGLKREADRLQSDQNMKAILKSEESATPAAKEEIKSDFAATAKPAATEDCTACKEAVGVKKSAPTPPPAQP